MLEVSSSLHCQDTCLGNTAIFEKLPRDWQCRYSAPHVHHDVIVVQLNGFISSSTLQQRPLYQSPTLHLDCMQYCGDTWLWSQCIQNCVKWALLSNPVTYIITTLYITVQTKEGTWSLRTRLTLWYIYIYIYIYIATHHEASNRKVKGDSYHESKTPVRVTHMQLAAIHSS